jgi:hypothetical protein
LELPASLEPALLAPAGINLLFYMKLDMNSSTVFEYSPKFDSLVGACLNANKSNIL